MPAFKNVDKTTPSVTVRSLNRILGEITTLPAPKGSDNWTSAIFSQSYLARIYWNLDKNNSLVFPSAPNKEHSIPLCRLDELGTIGYDVRDITDAFDIDKTGTEWTPHPAFWNHDADRVVQIAQKANAFLIPRNKPIEGRKLKSATAVWAKAGGILLVSRLWPITHKVLATGFDNNVLGNTWWAFDDSALTKQQRKALLLWLNSTFGLLLYFGRRAITRSAWMQMKKPAWEGTPVLDVRDLDAETLDILAKTYDNLANHELKPIAKLDSDPTRLGIDKALSDALGLPEPSELRELMVREPGLTGQE